MSLWCCRGKCRPEFPRQLIPEVRNVEALDGIIVNIVIHPKPFATSDHSPRGLPWPEVGDTQSGKGHRQVWSARFSHLGKLPAMDIEAAYNHCHPFYLMPIDDTWVENQRVSNGTD